VAMSIDEHSTAHFSKQAHTPHKLDTVAVCV
jgi:hypothetical protein